MALRTLFKRQEEKNKEAQSLRNLFKRQEEKNREPQGKVRSRMPFFIIKRALPIL
jgi:hypothetical protein